VPAGARQLVFETHSTSTDNEDGIATGWLDGRLSETGVRQAAELGERRRNDAIAHVYVSDLGRAVETARIAFGETTIPVTMDARLRECNYGDWNGMPVEQLDRERVRHVDEPFPGGQSYREVVEQMRSFLADIPQAEPRVLVVGHSATRWALDHLLLGRPLGELVAAPFGWQEGWVYSLE
jgi:broad specificity phosphatase PhoE